MSDIFQQNTKHFSIPTCIFFFRTLFCQLWIWITDCIPLSQDEWRNIAADHIKYKFILHVDGATAYQAWRRWNTQRQSWPWMSQWWAVLCQKSSSQASPWSAPWEKQESYCCRDAVTGWMVETTKEKPSWHSGKERGKCQWSPPPKPMGTLGRTWKGSLGWSRKCASIRSATAAHVTRKTMLQHALVSPLDLWQYWNDHTWCM